MSERDTTNTGESAGEKSANYFEFREVSKAFDDRPVLNQVSFAVKRPVQKLAGLSAGVSHGWSSLKTQRSWRDAVDEGKAAAARRERDLEDELKSHDG